MNRLEQISLANHLEIHHDKDYTPERTYEELSIVHERLHGYGDVEHSHKTGRSWDIDLPIKFDYKEVYG